MKSPNPFAPVVPMLGCEVVAELKWENGQLAMNGLGPLHVYDKPLATSSPTKNTWGEKPRSGGTLESVVKQATRFRRGKPAADGGGGDLVPCLDDYRATASGDALVPTAVRSAGARDWHVAPVPVAHVCSSCDDDDDSDSRNESGRDSWRLTSGSSERELGAHGFTSSSMGSPENTSSEECSTEATTSEEDRDTVCRCRSQAISVLLIFYFCNVDFNLHKVHFKS
ncbi:hypothetical protein Acr_14g0002970 [Actinidia rufa]|uniref:Uncharacterized protein n=1 Tax=Actinidia rufa TaxID=165716 RepID=A0A7J0FPM8_9ERIC|nr:hypothetical protein Acr_14g0002970 [Actinidia rufa]